MSKPTKAPAVKAELTDSQVIVNVQQRFYDFQNATSDLKRAGHNPDTAVFNQALDRIINYIDSTPSIEFSSFQL